MQRIKYIDLAKGLCITLVVFYHIFVQQHDCPKFISSLSVFRMPLYFFLSGLFFKEYEGFIGFLIRKVNKLLIPFLFFYLTVSFALSNFLHYYFGVHIAASQSLGIGGLCAFITDEQFANNPIWFLWVLFLVNIYFYTCLVLIKHFTKNPKYIAVSITMICFIFGFIGSVVLAGKYNLLAFLDSAMSALPFFALGYLFNKYTDILIPNRFDKYLPLIIVACFALTFYVGGRCSYRTNQFFIHPILQYICGLAGTLGIIFIAKKLNDLPFITYWGRYSIMILVSHAPILQVYIPLFKMLHLPNYPTKILVLVATMFTYMLVIPLMKKFLPYVTAQKDVFPVAKSTK